MSLILLGTPQLGTAKVKKKAGKDAAHGITNVETASDEQVQAIWDQFLDEIEKGEWPDDRLRMYPELVDLKDRIRGFLQQFDEDSLQQFRSSPPKIYRVDPHLFFVHTLNFEDGGSCTFCFTIYIEEGRWYCRALETLLIPMDDIPELPTSSFPDMPEHDKHWRRAEIQVTKDIDLWRFLKDEKGMDFAFEYFTDGRGYAVGTKTWLPYFPLHRSFVLYACWEQSVLRGNEVTLRELNDEQAVIHFDRSIYLALYQNTAHLTLRISLENYKKLFETIWTDRCLESGWQVSFEYAQDSPSVTLRLTRAEHE